MSRLASTLLAALLAAACHFASAQSLAPPVAGKVLTPAQSAWLDAEVRRSNELFVRRVVAITGMPPDTVRRAIPAAGRITDPAARTVAAIEQFGGKPLGDEQKTAIRAAEEDRRQMIATAREQAPKK